MFAVLIHIYYPDSWEKIMREHLISLRKHNPVLLINICNINNNIATIQKTVRTDFPDAIFIVSPNKGKDIGGKLLLIDLFLKMKIKADYMILLHDKISPHAIKGEKWRNTLFNIVSPENVNKILHWFAHNKQIGIIGSSEFIMNEYNQNTRQFATSNSKKIKELLEKYKINIKDFSFIGGTMFWIRSSVINHFFSQNPALICREMLEAGNVMDDVDGTYTHTWERLFCWIARDQNYILKGI